MSQVPSMEVLPWVVPLLIGLSAGLLLFGGRAWFVAKFRADVLWLRRVSLRFNPKPVHAELLVELYYVLLGILLIALIFLAPNIVIALLLWLALQFLPPFLVEAAWKKRRARIDEQLPAAIAAMCNSIRAGLTLVQSIQRMAETAPEPIRTEFQVIAATYGYGTDLESAIREAKARLDLQNFNLFASAVLLNREMGGNVAETLNRISRSLDKLKQMRETVKAHTSEGRTNIKILLVAPVVMLLMLASVDYDGVRMLFTTPQGYAVLLLAAILAGSGVYFAARITQSEV